MDTERTERRHETLRQILQVLFYLAVAVGVVLLFNSCIASAKEHSDAQDAEVYEEAYQEGYRDGQRALIKYLREEARGVILHPDDMASELLNGEMSREEFVEEWDELFDWLDNLEPVD